MEIAAIRVENGRPVCNNRGCKRESREVDVVNELPESWVFRCRWCENLSLVSKRLIGGTRGAVRAGNRSGRSRDEGTPIWAPGWR